MNRSIKTIISSMLVLVIILSVSMIPVEAKQTNDKKNNEKIVQVRFAYIDVYQNTFDIEDNGKASFATVLSSRNVDEVQLYGYLQQYSKGRWITLKTWSNKMKCM